MTLTRRVNAWLLNPEIEQEIKDEIKLMTKEELEASFLDNLDFGSGGLRALLGPGYKRMNKYTVRWLAQACAEYWQKESEPGEKKIILGYDYRWQSKNFAWELAKVLAANDFLVLFPLEAFATPILSYSVRALGAQGGIMVTASHNPPQYNGLKIYTSTGAQGSTNLGQRIMAQAQALDFFKGPLFLLDKEARLSPFIEWLPLNLVANYSQKIIDYNLALRKREKRKERLKIAYSPLYGTGLEPVTRVLQNLDMEIYPVLEESVKDPRFGPLGLTNPEELRALENLKKLGERKSCDLLLATDPDSDRLGALARDKTGTYFHFSGNQIGILLADYILARKKEEGLLTPEHFLVRSVVSTNMADQLALDYGIRLYEALIGFRYMGPLVEALERKNPASLILAFEDSNGYLAGGNVRDKDGVMAAALLSELALSLKEKKLTLVDKLNELYKKYGYYQEGLGMIPLEQEGQKRLMTSLREKPLREILGRKVTSYYDYLKGWPQEKNTLEEYFAPANLVQMHCAEEIILSIRPSGTEPKLKIYLGVKAQSQLAGKELLKEIFSFLEEEVFQEEKIIRNY